MSTTVAGLSGGINPGDHSYGTTSTSSPGRALHALTSYILFVIICVSEQTKMIIVVYMKEQGCKTSELFPSACIVWQLM